MAPCLPWIAATALTAVAASTDLRSRTIPNALTYPALGIGFALACVPELGIGLANALAGCLAGALPALLLFCTGRLGGGDLKLLAAVGTLLGLTATLEVLYLSVLCGAVTALAMGAARVSGRARAALCGQAPPACDGSLPFAVPIAIATACLPWFSSLERLARSVCQGVLA
jgi:prepilin peptidase CpaA